MFIGLKMRIVALDQRTFENIVLSLGAENIENRQPERCRFSMFIGLSQTFNGIYNFIRPTNISNGHLDRRSL